MNLRAAHPNGVGVLADVAVEVLRVLAVSGQLGGQVQALVLQLVVQGLHVELLQVTAPVWGWRHIEEKKGEGVLWT